MAQDDETEEELYARIEAEERAKLEQDSWDDEALTLQPAGGRGGASKLGALDEVSLGSLVERVRGACAGDSDRRAGAGLGAVARRFGLLGVMAVGGPAAQVGLLQAQPWRPALVGDAAFASLFALIQCLPGPTSAQMAAALGVLQAGPSGGLVAFGAFSAAGAAAMAALGSVHIATGDTPSALLLSVQMGVAAAGVALVASSALSLLARDRTPIYKALSVGAAAAALYAPTGSAPLPACLGAAGLTSVLEAWWRRRRDGGDAAEGSAAGLRDDGRADDDEATVRVPLPGSVGVGLAMCWLALLLLLLVLADQPWARLIGPFYVSGSMAWGGGPAVFPLLLREAPALNVSDAGFLQGVALAHALPGSVFSVGAYLGGASAGLLGAALCWTGLHLPGLLLVYAALPFWAALRASAQARVFLRGVGAATSGLIVAAALLLYEGASSPPQHAIAALALASHHAVWPATAASKYSSQLTVGLGAALGVPLCLPWLLSQNGGQPDAGPPASVPVVPTAHDAAVVLAGGHRPPPPPPSPEPSPPPPPAPRLPEGARAR